MRKVNVLVIDDSAFMRKLISDFLNEHPEIEVIGTARNGEEGLEKIKTLNPTVVTLDVEMPILDGLETLKMIMDNNPLPVIMLSSTTKAGAEITIRCLQYGAFDFLTKPSGPISLDLQKIKNQLIEKVLQAASAKTKVENRIAEVKPNTTGNFNEKKTVQALSNQKVLVGIGTSTGGPRALQQVIPNLSKDLSASYFVVQHMPPGFTQSLAERLNAMSQLTVKEATHGEIVQNGVVYIAPGGLHMQVVQKGNNLKIEIVESPQNVSYRPSVDLLFESLSQIKDYTKIAVIMTGMGHDGTKGLKKLKSSGTVTTIAQSEETSIIFGMPKSAIEANVIDYIADLKDIPHMIQRLI